MRGGARLHVMIPMAGRADNGSPKSPFGANIPSDGRRPRGPKHGVRCGIHACWRQAMNCWRTALARAWSYPIPYAIGARIASDYAGRPVLPLSRTVRRSLGPGRGRIRTLDPRRGCDHRRHRSGESGVQRPSAGHAGASGHSCASSSGHARHDRRVRRGRDRRRVRRLPSLLRGVIGADRMAG